VTPLLLLALTLQASPSPSPVVTVEAPAELAIRAGEPAELRLKATIAPGYKIQANPASQPFLVPARLELVPHDRVRAGAPEYPAGKPYRLEGASSDLSIYEGTFVIRVPLEAAAASVSAPGSRGVLEGKLHYQACDRVRCLRPSSVPVRLSFRLDPLR
jgi:hypothetical protein